MLHASRWRTVALALIGCLAPLPAAAGAIDAASLCHALAKGSGSTAAMIDAQCRAAAPLVERQTRQLALSFAERMARRCDPAAAPGRSQDPKRRRGCAAVEFLGRLLTTQP
jgi:hypothetical protein